MRVRRSGALLAVVGVLILGACQLGDGPVAEEPGHTEEPPASVLAERFDLSGLQVALGTKDFTEMLILGELARLALEEAGATVDYTPNLPSPEGPREALLDGELDLHWEYTGTGWHTFLGSEEVIADDAEQFAMLREADRDRHDIVWLPPAPLDDSYGIAVRTDYAERAGLETLSDAAELVATEPDEATLCLDGGFADRADGLPAVEETYEFEWPSDRHFVGEPGVIYVWVADGEPCNFGEVLTTDGRLAVLDLTVLDDDRNAFITYRPAMTLHAELAEEHPELRALFALVADDLDTAEMIELNAAVDVHGESAADVAAGYLRERDLIE